jgi:hypothetical protein
MYAGLFRASSFMATHAALCGTISTATSHGHEPQAMAMRGDGGAVPSSELSRVWMSSTCVRPSGPNEAGYIPSTSAEIDWTVRGTSVERKCSSAVFRVGDR